MVLVENYANLGLSLEEESELRRIAADLASVLGQDVFRVVLTPNFRSGQPMLYSVVFKMNREGRS